MWGSPDRHPQHSAPERSVECIACLVAIVAWQVCVGCVCGVFVGCGVCVWGVCVGCVCGVGYMCGVGYVCII